MAASELIASSSHILKLPDGRELAYVDCGDSSSKDCVLFLHPVQGNRLMSLIFHAQALELGLRIIAPDRPGYGGSTQQPGRNVAAHVRDIAHLLVSLGITRVSLLASSAGSMYAMALTRDPETRNLVTGRVTLLPPWIPPGSLAPGSRPPWTLKLLSHIPAAATGLFVGLTNGLVMRKLAGAGVKVADVMTRSTPSEVEAFLQDPANDAYYRAMINEWARPGAPAGIAAEMLLCAEAGAARRLGFSYLTDVEAPVRVFVGSNDPLVPAPGVHAWSAAAPGGRVEVVEVEGGTHDGVVHTHKEAALAAIAGDLRGTPVGGGSG